MNVRLLAGVAVLGVLGAGCSAGTSPSTPTPTPSVDAPATAAPTPTPAAASCPDGGYLVTKLEGRGQASQLGTGTGGNIAADFSAGTFTLSSDGSAPVTLDRGPGGTELSLDGTIVSTYAGDPSALALSLQRADGEVTIKAFGVRRSQPLARLADQLIGQGTTAQATCDDAAGTAVLDLPSARLTLARR